MKFRGKHLLFDFHLKTETVSTLIVKEIKNAPSALLSYLSTREFLRTREKCREARAYIPQQCTRNKFFISFIKYKQSQLLRQVQILMNQHQVSPYTR